MPTDNTAQKPVGFGSGSLDPKAQSQHRSRHGRIPSVVLSPSPSSDNLRSRSPVEKDILITLDDPIPSPQSETLTTYHETVSKPEFWQKLYQFLQ
jgi:UV excision repair protein RAD23